jgi:transcriptional regulator with XRE-family HTH domain
LPNPRIKGHDNEAVQRLGERMRAARQRAGRTQREMSDEMGVAERSVQRWESGFYEPGAFDLLKWSLLTDTSLYWLLGVREGEQASLSRNALDVLSEQARKWQDTIDRLRADLPDDAANGS